MSIMTKERWLHNGISIIKSTSDNLHVWYQCKWKTHALCTRTDTTMDIGFTQRVHAYGAGPIITLTSGNSYIVNDCEHRANHLYVNCHVKLRRLTISVGAAAVSFASSDNRSHRQSKRTFYYIFSVYSFALR